MPNDPDITPSDHAAWRELRSQELEQLAAHRRTLEQMSGTAAESICRTAMVIIPALNEAGAISSVVSTLRRWPLAGIRVVDNGSRDETGKMAAEAGAEVMHEPVRGYGAACWRGLAGLPPAVHWVLFCDGDGSDDLWALRPFFERAAEGCDLVLGNRNAFPDGRSSLSLPQRFGNALAGHLIGWKWKTRFHDLGPLRLIRRKCLDELDMKDRGFGWTVEMQAKAAGHALRCVEVPVPYHKRQSGQSKISGTIAGSMKAGAVILGTLGRLAWRDLRR